jgi:hypothetical protein
VAIKEFTGELDPVKPSRAVEFTGELDPIKPGRAVEFTGELEEIKPTKSAGFSAKDTAIALGQGVVGAGKSIADVFGADNVASKALGSVSKTLGEQVSPERQAEMARRQALQEKASKSGSLTEEISTFLGGVAEAPVQSLAQGIGSIVPFVGTGILGSLRLLGGPTIKALNAAIGTGMGAGSVKGSLYDNVKQELEKSGMRPEEAAARASKAQEYLGENFLDIATGAALGGVASMYGVEKALIPGAKDKLGSSLIPRVTKAALAEAPLEGVQGGQEQLAINRALQKQGFNVGTLEGVAGATARDAAVGALTGAAVGVRGPSPVAEPPPPPTTEPGTETTTTPPPVAPPAMDAATEALLASTIDPITGQFVQQFVTPPEAPVIAEADKQAAIKQITDLETDNIKIQAKLAAGEYKVPKAIANAKAKLAKQQALIDELKTRVGDQNVIQPIDAGASGDGAGISGEPDTSGTAPGTAGVGSGLPGVGGDQGLKSTPEDGTAAQQPALSPPYRSFFRWAAQNGINLPEDGETSDFPELVERWGAETNQPQDLINELAGIEKTNEYFFDDTEVIKEAPVETQKPATAVNTTQKIKFGDSGTKGALLTLDSGKAVEVTQYGPNEWIGPNGEDLGTTLEETAATILARETTNPVPAVNENRRVELVEALEKKATERKDREERRKNKVIDLADERKAKIEEEENRLDDEDEILEAEQDALNKEAAAELAGEITPTIVTPTVVTPTKPPVIEEFTGELDEETPRGAIEAKVKTFDGIRNLLSSRKKDEKTGKDKPGTGIESFDKKVKVAGPKGKVVKEVKIAKPIKWRGKKGTETANPSPYNFLNKNSYYSDKSPEQIAKQSEVLAAENKNKNKKIVSKNAIEAGVESAAFDEAYDLYDSIAYEEKVLPEIKQILAKRQDAKNADIDAANEQREINRKAKKTQLTSEGKSVKVIKEALSVIKDVPRVEYQETKPLEFMSEQEVLDLFKKNVGTKTNLEEDEGGQARVDLAKDRTAFVDVLSPNDKIKFSMMAEVILDMEIISAVQDNKVTTAGDRRTENYRKKQEAKVISEVEQQLKDAEITAKQIEQKAARIAKRAEEKKQERAQVTKEVETEEAETKSKLVVGIEKGIVEGSLDTVLEVIADKKKQLNESTTRNIAQSFIDLVNDFGNITIQFGSVPKGKDGQFDPSNNTITIKGENGVYTGERALDETVLHEVGHYLTDHIFDSAKNKKAYIESIPTAFGKRKAAQAAINRLENNYRLVKNKLGKKFNISTIKEFIAEIYSNPRFQEAVASLDTGDLGTDYTRFIETKAETATEEAEGYVTGNNRDIQGPVKKYIPAKESLFQKIVKNIANVLGFNISEKEGFVNDPARGVTLKQSIEDIARIISLPTADIRSTKVSYSTAAAAAAPSGDVKTPKYLHVTDPDSTDRKENAAFNAPERPAPRLRKMVTELFTTVKPWRELARLFQDRSYFGNFLQKQLNSAGLINFVNTPGAPDKGINNFMTQINLAVSKGRNLYMAEVSGLYTELNSAVNAFVKATDKSLDDALKTLHIYLQALHEPERRDVKYVFLVPLSTKENIPQKGSKTGMISVAKRRQQIIGEPDKGIPGLLNDPNVTEAQSKALRAELDTYIFEKNAKGEFVLDANGYKKPNTKYVDPLGYSPNGTKDIVIVNPAFLVGGMDPLEVKIIAKKYENHPQKAEMDAVIKQLKALHKVTIKLNKDAYYWSQPVSNRVAFYGFNNYVPLKADKNHQKIDEEISLNFDGLSEDARKGKQFQDIAQPFVGHIAPSNNPVLQTLSEAIVAANRAGNGTDLTLSVRNALEKSDLNPDGQGLIKGTVVQHIPFSERSKTIIDAIKRENTIFHYNKDGSIDVLEIQEKKIRDSIRRTYETANQLVQVLNTVTSTLGQLHTRYNFNFAPLNFVRDALTNAWAIGASMGPKKSVEFIAQIAAVVAKTGFTGKAFKVASLYESKNINQLEAMAKKDPDIRDMYELIKEGGMVEYMEGLSIKSNLNKLRREVGRSGVMTKIDQLNRIIDIWTNVFEIASRSAAYGVTKKSFHTKNIAKGMDDKPGPNGAPSPALKAAMVEAADFSKNLANFQQVGEYGRGMGAMFMFFRPSATGAVRAIEAVAPAFRKIEDVLAELPPIIKDNPKAKAAFKKDYEQKQKSAKEMMTILMAMGAFAYMMSVMMSEEDDMGRNKAETDDLGQWNRFWRIHIPGIDTPFQLPWGFGLGSFMAAGAQMMAAFMGNQSFGSALTNVGTQIALDSFVPIPVSRMSAVENPGMWFIDSITPSALRPIVELVVNKNGLGQDIKNVASSRRMGDAFLGGDNIPESYKDIATYANVATGGFIDASPNVMYFLFNSYMDGPARLGDLVYNSMYLATGEKEFKAKTDVPLIGSFIGAAPNVDGREWTSTEKQILEMKRRLNAPNPDAVDKFLDRNPLAEIVTSLYDKNLTELNRLRKEGNDIRAAGYSPKDRVQLLEMNKMEQNMVKANLVEMFKDYDIKP